MFETHLHGSPPGAGGLFHHYAVHPKVCFRANMAHIRQSMPDYVLGFQVKTVRTFEAVSCTFLILAWSYTSVNFVEKERMIETHLHGSPPGAGGLFRHYAVHPKVRFRANRERLQTYQGLLLKKGLKPGPESGFDCLACSAFTRRRTSAARPLGPEDCSTTTPSTRRCP